MINKKDTKYDKEGVNKEINYAVKTGIYSLMQANPLFKSNEEYILSHLDNKAIQNKIKNLYEELKEKDINDNKKVDYLKSEIKKYISSGQALDEAGKGIILGKGLEGKTVNSTSFFNKIFPFTKKKEQGREYLEQTISAFQDLYTLFKKNGQEYQKSMPEIDKALTTVNDMGFLIPAINVLKYYKMIDDKKYNSLKKDANKKVKESSEQVISGIERSITQDIAAGFFGVLGIFMLFASKMNLTGNIIGISLYEPSITLFHALAPLTISLILFWRNKRRMNSKKFKKIKLKE